MFSSETENTATWHGLAFPKLISHTSIGGDNKDVKSIIKYSNFGKSLSQMRRELDWKFEIILEAGCDCVRLCLDVMSL